MTDERLSVPDAAARQRIVTDLASTLFVEAGAGTGKTTALVSRIIAALRSGICELREIAAITFTEAAAFELRERIRSAVAVAASDAPLDERLRRALQQVDEAAITTIHGFCQKILAEHPLDAGLPLRFEVLDDVASAIAFDRRFFRFLDALYDEPDSRSLLAAASCLQISPAQLRLLARQLDERWDEAPSTHPEGESAERIEQLVWESVTAVTTALQRLDELGGCCVDETDALARRIVELEPEQARGGQLVEWTDALRWLAELRIRRSGNLGRKDAWRDVEVQTVRQALAAVEERRGEGISAIADVVLSGLVRRLGVEARRSALERHRNGTLNFHDLLVLTDGLLRDAPQVRRAVRARFVRILVDEFQDTDPLQLRIVLQLGAAEPGGDLEPGRLFFVGDPKQSVYGFRGADAAAYAHALETLGVASSPTRLVANFRSVPSIIAWVNSVFSQLLADHAGEGFVGLEAVVDEVAPGTSVTVLGGAVEEGVTQSERRSIESGDVAEAVARAVRDGWLVRDVEGPRPAHFSDVAILVPRRTGLFALEKALEARDIPYLVASSTLIYNSMEVRDLRAVLAAIAPAADERAVVGALRTPAFGCSDDELLAYRFAGGEFRLAAPSDDATGPVAAALAGLAELHQNAFHLGIVGVLEQLLRERRLVAVQAAASRQREALRRIDFVLERARFFEETGSREIGAFLSFLDLEAQIGVRSVDLPATDVAEDAVKILTVHGAKGLEFPIVVLAELGGAMAGGGGGPRILAGADGRLEVRARSGTETRGFAAVAREVEQADIAESLRIGYVAATRARDHLVVALHHRRSRSDSSRSLAERIAMLDDLPATRHEPATEGRVTPSCSIVDRRVTPPPLDIGMWRRDRDTLLETWRRPARVTATNLVPPLERTSVSRSDASQEGDEWRRPRAATKVGRAVHRVLQEVPLLGADGLEELARAIAVDEGCEADAAIAARMVRAALESPIITRAANRRYWRELPLTAALPGGVLEAVVDLLFEDDHGLVIVDYKTDAVSSLAEIEQLGAHYRSQVGAYALALEALGTAPVSEAVLLFLGVAGEPVEFRIEELPTAVAEARDRAAAVFAGVLS